MKEEEEEKYEGGGGGKMIDKPEPLKERMRLYSVGFNDEEGCSVAVVAENAKEAKKIAWNNSDFLNEIAQYIEISVKWLRGNTKGLDKGIHEDYIELLKRGFFSYVINCDCPRCKTFDTDVYRDNKTGMIYCSKCEDEAFEEGKEAKDEK